MESPRATARARYWRAVGITAIAVLGSCFAIADQFSGWRKFADGGDGSKWYYFLASVKPIYHYQTGKFLGEYVWAGWENADGTYDQARYSIYCASGTYMMDGHVEGSSVGAEKGGMNIMNEEPYRPQSFVWVLAEVVCSKAGK